MADELEAGDLARRVCELLGVEIQWLASAKQIWIVDSETGDMVTAVMELKDGQLQEQPLEVTRDSVLLKVETESSEMAAKALLECIGMVKRLSYGLDVETLEPVKTVENPFFGLKSREEIAVKLDLLAGWRGSYPRT